MALKKQKFSRPQLLVFALVFAAIGGFIIYKSFAASSFGANIPVAPAYPTSLPERIVTDFTGLQSAVAAGNTRVKVVGKINIPVDWRWTTPNVWVYGDSAGGAALVGGSVKINTSDIWVSNLEIFGGTYDGIKLGDGAAASRVVIADNWIHDVGDQGVLVAANGAQNIWIMRNKIEKVNHTDNPNVAADGHGIYTGGYGGVTKHIYILSNEIHPSAFGVQAYPEPDDVVISGNSIIGGDTRGGVVIYSGATNVKAIGNLIVDAPSAAFEVDAGGAAATSGNRADENVCLRCKLWSIATPPGSGNISTTSQTTADSFRVRTDQWGWLPSFLKDGSARSVANVGSSYSGSSTTPPSTSCNYTINPGANVATEFDKLTAGQTLCLNSGTYGGPTVSYILNNNNGTSSSPLKITTTPGQARATIEGQLTVGNNTATGLRNNITVSHLAFKLDKVDPNARVTTGVGCNPDRVAGIVLTGSNIIFEYNDVSEASAPASTRDTAIGVNYTGNSTRTSNVIIRNNKIHDYGACTNHDHGIYFDYVDNGQMYGNWIWNGPCSYDQHNDPTKGCGAGIQLWSDPIGTNIYGNIIDGTGIGFYISKNHNSVHNNVMTNMKGTYYSSSTTSTQPPVAYDGYIGDSTNTFTNNDYFNAGSLCTNCTATASGNITADPMFVDQANHDYRLKAGSPVAGYGLWDGVDPYFSGGTTPPPAAKPTIPTGLKATAGNAQVVLTWSPNPAGDNVDTYQVYWTTDSTWAATPQQALNVSGNSYTVTGLTNSTAYYFRISAHNATDYGDWTAPVSATPTAPVSSIAGDLNNDGHVTITDMSILLSNYGTTNVTSDINKDGSVNITDLSILLSHYGA